MFGNMKKYFFILIVVCGILDAIYPLDVGFYTNLCILPAIVGAGIALTAASGIMNAHSQANANATNAALTKAQLEEQKRQFNENMAWNKYQYEDQKHYNTLLAQVGRARAAGINPEFVLGNMNAGNVQSVGGAAPTASFGGIPQQPLDYSFIGNSATTGMQAFFDNQLKDEQATQLKIDNFYRADHHILEIQKMIADGQLSVSRRKSLEEELAFNKRIRDELYEGLVKDNRTRDQLFHAGEYGVIKAYHDTRMAAIQADLAEWEKQYRQKYGEADLKRMSAIIRNLDADTAKKNMEKLESEARKNGLNLDNESKKTLAPLIERATSLQNDKLAAESEDARMRAWYGKNPWEYFTRQNGRSNFGYPAQDYLQRTNRW